MRLLEFASLLMLLVGAYALLSLSPEVCHISLSLLAVLTSLSLLGHLFLERARYQMVPAYAAAVGLLSAIGLQCLFHAGPSHALELGCATALFALISALLCVVMPVFRLPAPTGEYRVGTHLRHLVDPSRNVPYLDVADPRRELMVQIWYPTSPTCRGSLAPYRERAITTWRSAQFSLVKTHSICNAELSSSRRRFPVVLFLPSWAGVRTECTALVEELASHGYIVVGIDHPYSSSRVVLPDGRIACRKFVGDEDYSSEAAFEAFVKVANEQISIRAADARFVLDCLELFDRADPQGVLTGRLDLNRIGVFGFSLGGGAAAEVCSLDDRVKAGADLAGMIGRMTAERLRFAPFLFMFEGMYDEKPFVPEADLSYLAPAKRREITFSLDQFATMKRLLARRGGYWMTIRGAEHMHFSDAKLYSPLRQGLVSPVRIIQIVRCNLVAFFDHSMGLAGEATSSRAIEDASPIVRLQYIDPVVPGA